jgi:superoxide reductase
VFQEYQEETKMATIAEKLQQADWKKEKHAPVIESPDEVKAGEVLVIDASVGKEIAHPNTTEHHINYISLFFLADGEKNPHQIGQYEFSAHGESTTGPNLGPVYTMPAVTSSVKLTVSGTLLAVSFCNIHGLWESSKTIRVV